MIAVFACPQNKKIIIKSPPEGIFYREDGFYFHSYKKDLIMSRQRRIKLT